MVWGIEGESQVGGKNKKVEEKVLSKQEEPFILGGPAKKGYTRKGTQWKSQGKRICGGKGHETEAPNGLKRHGQMGATAL